MNIRHECPLPDLSFSVTAPLHLHRANGCKTIVRRWSLAGVWLDPHAQDLSGDVHMSVPFQGVEVSFPIRLLRTETPGHYRFQDLTVRQRETLSTFHQGLLTGQMVSTADMITSLDTPVDLVPMTETDAEATAGRATSKPRGLRIAWNAALYALLAGLLLAFLGTHIWQRVSRIELEHARFTAPVVAYTVPDAGYVSRLYVGQGDTVAAGDVLAKIEDPDRESDVEDVRAEVMLSERRLIAAQERLARHAALHAVQRAALRDAFQRVWTQWQSHDPRAAQYPPHIDAAWRARYTFDRGRDAQAGGYFDMLATLKATVEERELDLRRWKRALRHRKAAADKLLIRAQNTGTVLALHARKNDHVERNQLVVEVEDNRPREAVAWLDDAMATRVYVGMKAQISYVYRGEKQTSAGTVTDVQAGTDALQPDRYGMVLTIKADDAGVLNTRKWLHRNAPAQISLMRQNRFAFWKG